MKHSYLGATLDRIANQSAEAISDFLRSNNAGLNGHIRSALSVSAGKPGSLLADPIIEVAQDWAPAAHSFGDLAGGMLDARLVAALDQAKSERMPRERYPYQHQVKAWQAAGAGQSVLVSSGTGSGKTECFMIPILHDILKNPAPGGGIRAIIVYPLNALIQSQRDRLSAWVEGLGGAVTYALYSGDTPHKPDGTPAGIGEILDRKSLREKPPTILVTNITMLEYMLLRAEDQAILRKSQGLLRWIVLDEAHSYVGAQASEMAMLLRRVRAAFGVAPQSVRLMATSATIEDDTGTRLSEFMQGLSGVDASGVTVIMGETVEAPLPKTGPDAPLNLADLTALPDDAARWQALAPHPRLQSLRSQLKSGLTLGQIAQHCLGRADARAEAEALLDLAAQARPADGALPLFRWRRHLFLRALGGAWACLDPACPHASTDLRNAADWPFGQVHFTIKERCTCGKPCMEVVVCGDCGTPHLKAKQDFGVHHRLILPKAGTDDDFSADVEPDSGAAILSPTAELWVTTNLGRGRPCLLDPDTLDILSDTADAPAGHLTLHVVDSQPVCPCNETRNDNAFKHLRFSPAYLMGHNMQTMIEAFSLPDQNPVQKPLAGRGAISFTDSRQGVARLAAKMQAEAERNLTRAFLYHEAQMAQDTSTADPGQIADLERSIAMLSSMGQASTVALLQDQLNGLRAAASGLTGVKWDSAVADLAGHPEMGLYVREVWKDRDSEFATHNEALARVLMMREIMRRPKRQNNVETMGLARLVFPALERTVLQQNLPAALQGRHVTQADYLGLVLSAVDFFFREKMVVALEPARHMHWIVPKWGRLRKACNNDVRPEDRADSEPFPSALPNPGQRLNRIALNALALTGGSRDNPADLEEADVMLRQVYKTIVEQACKIWSTYSVALDFAKAEVQPYGDAWLCPVSRRVFGYAIKGCSPLDATRPMTRLQFPLAPVARRGGLTAEERQSLADWLSGDPQIAQLRVQGVWTGLQSRAVLYSPYMRAQEHSAQLPRSQLKDYEAAFNVGKINLLACSTTMEMGVDLSNVGLVVNSNVPPSVSNYRQRVGRAGRRREPWAFGVTWCRDLPLDNKVFEEPRRLLQGRMAAPRVTLNSAILMGRHVNAAALAGWLRAQGGMNVMDKIGPFFGMDPEGKTLPDAPADRFIAALTGPDATLFLPDMATLLKGSCLENRSAADLARDTAEAMKALCDRWRGEYKSLVQRSKATAERDISKALSNRAASMHGTFLLSDLSKSGFTPAYGFPSDVVSFDFVGGAKEGADAPARDEYQGRSGATRTLDVALREYAPGSDIVINSLVYTSEGIRPAWSTSASASNLEDLRQLYQCAACGKPHLARDLPESCSCGAAVVASQSRKTLRPVGFIGRSTPHIGYELLQASAFAMPQISADDAVWQDIAVEPGLRLRATASGQVITLGSGEEDAGYAICLICGRAVSEHATTGLGLGPVPASMVGHRPLVTGPRDTVVSGRCVGGDGGLRIQRNVHLLHDRRTDVFELQMPAGTTAGTAFAFVAGLRESLAAWLGVEPDELGLAVGTSKGADLARRVSAFVYDRAAGRAGLALRLGEEGRLASLIADVVTQLDCPDHCAHGCPSCILRPDMNMAQVTPDRAEAAVLALRLRNQLRLDPRKQVFGPQTVAMGQPLFDLISQQISTRTAQAVTLFVRGTPATWALSDWPVLAALRLWRQDVPVELVFATDALTDPTMDVPTRMHLMRLAPDAGLAHRTTLPHASLLPLLAIIQTADGLRAVAAVSRDEALPDGNWGKGAADLLVAGPVNSQQDWSYLPAIDLLPQVEAGKSAHCVMGNRLNVPLSQFGRAFWQMIGQDAPALHALLAREGVAELRYDDRYLLKPVQFQMLREMLLAMPGRRTATVLRVYTMQTPPGDAPTHLEGNLACDQDREDLFDQLFPGDRISIRPKGETEHARCMTLSTQTGQKVMLYLDQGIDLWRLSQKWPTANGLQMTRLAAELEQSGLGIRARPARNPSVFIGLV